MKNTKWEIGGWKMTNPHIVVKLGFVIDSYKVPKLPEMWKKAEAQAKTMMANFVAEDFFHQEEFEGPGEKIVTSCRWYTPASNRTKIVPPAPSDIKGDLH